MNFSEIKVEAKNVLKGNWPKAAVICLLAYFLQLFLVLISEIFKSIDNIFKFIIPILCLIVYISLNYAIYAVFFKFRKNEKVTITSIITIAFDNFGKSLSLFFRIFVKLLPLSLTSTLLLSISLGVLSNTSNSSLLKLTALVSLILGFVLLFILTIRSACYYLSYITAIEHPDLSCKEAINNTIIKFKNNEVKFALFEVSFIGWIILSIFTFGLGFLLLIPYMQISNIIFYESLDSSKNENASA